jgi:hypothetical protein
MHLAFLKCSTAKDRTHVLMTEKPLTNNGEILLALWAAPSTRVDRAAGPAGCAAGAPSADHDDARVTGFRGLRPTLTKRESGVYECVVVKPLARPLLTLVLVALTGGAALAHVDTLGEPDPYWQRGANASTDGNAEIGGSGTAPGRAAAAVPRLLEVFVYASGGLSLFLLLSLLRSLRGSRRRSGA